MRGGKRRGSGRPKGSRNKRSLAQIEEAAEAGLRPLEFLLAVMRDENECPRRRMEAAVAAAPFVHAKLKSIEHTGADGGPMQVQHEMVITCD